MSKHQYYRNGKEINEDEALDCNNGNVLRDQVTMRVRTQVRDDDPWRSTNPRGKSEAATGAGEHGQQGMKVGDLCTKDGYGGRIQEIGGELVCVINKKADALPQFNDGTSDPTAGNRPGWRIPTVNDRRTVCDAYLKYNIRMANMHRLHDGEISCPVCESSGTASDGGPCDRCGGDGIVDDSGYETDPDEALNSVAKYDASRPLAQRLQDHRRNMDRLYAARDAELSAAWRNK